MKINPQDPFGTGDLLETPVTEDVLAKGIFGTAKWYIDTNGTMHIGPGNFGRLKQSTLSPWDVYKDKIKKIIFPVTEKIIANTDSGYLFANLTNLEKIENINNWDTSNVTNMRYMFADASGITNLALSNFDTAKVIDMTNIFGGMTSLQTDNIW